MSEIKFGEILKEYPGVYATGEYSNITRDIHIETIKKAIIKKGKIIDIGANLGIMSIYYCQEIENTEIICFEPTPHIAELAKKNLELTGFNYTFHQCALSNFNGESEYQFNSMHQTNKILKDNVGSSKVETHTLDYFEIDDVCFIKIDVEGHEVEVMEGSIQTIVTNKSPILLEYHPEANSSELFSIIDSINYEYKFLSSESFIPDRINQILLLPK